MNQLFKKLNIKLTYEQENKFKKYFEILIEENKKYNLTAITDYQEVVIKHFYDSLTLGLAVNFSSVQTLCDIGTGAGFPAIPLKIVYPHLNIFLVESQTKKTTFLNYLIKALELNGINVFNERAEDMAKKYSNSFDIVTARAVSPLNILNELCIPLVKEDGYFIAMKGSSYKNELEDAKNGIMILGSFLDEIIEVELPQSYGLRYLLKIKKSLHIDGYPRTYAQIKKKPI